MPSGANTNSISRLTWKTSSRDSLLAPWWCNRGWECSVIDQSPDEGAKFLVHFAHVRQAGLKRHWPSPLSRSSERLLSGLSGADTDRLLQFQHEDLPVPDLAGVGGLGDCIDHTIRHVIRDSDIDLHLGQEIHHILGTPIELGVSFLPSKPLDIGNRDSLHADLGQRLTNIVQFERFDNRRYQFHGGFSSLFADG